MSTNIIVEKRVCESIELENTTCHRIPCQINYRGKSSVSKYFTSNIREKEDNESVVSCSFRGHPLHGSKIQVPAGYLGVVLEGPKKLKCDGNRELNMIGNFKTFTSWNWDQVPSSNDKLVQALDWIDVSAAIHKPIDPKMQTEDELSVVQTLNQEGKRTLSDIID